ncbi:hypothetical protein FYM52_04680 [Comamonas sp. CAH-2]|uniref:hypothetical protein n=1 Tax=Comamonas sp. CAH-2 TaxID=2605745 RepID=UPI0012AE42C3|nr:hypothetical protein [Comamonas sp. CAH-2]MRT19647.1 hypothetical protein [Comamonas sp. CAH-2]
MSQPKTPSTADDLPFKDVPIQMGPGWRPKARFLSKEEVGDLPIPTFVTFADADDKPKWPK